MNLRRGENYKIDVRLEERNESGAGGWFGGTPARVQAAAEGEKV